MDDWGWRKALFAAGWNKLVDIQAVIKEAEALGRVPSGEELKTICERMLPLRLQTIEDPQ